MIEGSGRPKNIPGSATLMYGFEFNLKKTSFAPDSILVNRVRIQRSMGPDLDTVAGFITEI